MTTEQIELIVAEVARQLYEHADTIQIFWRIGREGVIDLLVVLIDGTEKTPIGLPLARSGLRFRPMGTTQTDLGAVLGWLGNSGPQQFKSIFR